MPWEAGANPALYRSCVVAMPAERRHWETGKASWKQMLQRPSQNTSLEGLSVATSIAFRKPRRNAAGLNGTEGELR